MITGQREALHGTSDHGSDTRRGARHGPLKKNGDNVDQEVFAFMTTEPNALTASINHERMPVLITDPADFDTWLSGSTEEALSYAAEQMRIVQAGSEREDLLKVDRSGADDLCLQSRALGRCSFRSALSITAASNYRSRRPSARAPTSP